MNSDEELEFDLAGPPPEPDKPCGTCGKVTSTVRAFIPGVGENYEDFDAGELCYDCAWEEGYCYGCGAFSAGQQAFDFGKPQGYCGNCQEQIHDTVANDDDEDDFDDVDDDEGFM